MEEPNKILIDLALKANALESSILKQLATEAFNPKRPDSWYSHGLRSKMKSIRDLVESIQEIHDAFEYSVKNAQANVPPMYRDKDGKWQPYIPDGKGNWTMPDIRPMEPRLKPGDVVVMSRLNGFAENTSRIDGIRIFDPKANIIPPNEQIHLSASMTCVFAVLRDEPTDRQPYLFLTPQQAGLDGGWLAIYARHLYVPDPVTSNRLLAVVNNLRDNAPAAYASWFERLAR
jgi:hypothetical protein